MLWLAAHMWMLLLAAFAIGLGVGWWIWGAGAPDGGAPSEEESMGTLEIDFEAPDEDAREVR